MLKMTLSAMLLLSATNMAFAVPKVGDSCTNNAQCNMQSPPGQPAFPQTLKCNTTTKKCENLGGTMALPTMPK